MQTPCGKCSTCPCSKKDKRQAEQSQPQSHCQSAAAPAPQPAPAQKTPNVECLCVSRRRQVQQTAPLTPIADTYTCTRARPEPTRQVPMEERCTCRIKPTPAQCECAPPAQSQPQQQTVYRQDPMPPTQAQIACGQPLPNQYNQRPQQYVQPGPTRCGHCQQSQERKKKCGAITSKLSFRLKMAESNEKDKAQFCEKTATTSNETANCQMAASESQASKAPKTGPGCLCTPPGQPSREVLSYGGPVGNQCGPAAVPAPVYNLHLRKREGKRRRAQEMCLASDWELHLTRIVQQQCQHVWSPRSYEFNAVVRNKQLL
ncbi:hypothetical protein ACLKA6_004486 [Drosophila palustris]